MLTRITAPLIKAGMRRSLRRSLRRVCWIGPVPEVAEELPVIAYANHNHFLDGHLLWLTARELFRRPFIVWMEELDRYPFFAAQGAMPFPPDDADRRSATIRRSRTELSSPRHPFLAYFPGGRLTAPESGLPAEDPRTFRRLSRIMPPATWLPIAIHVTWWAESVPTALLAAGSPHREPTGDEMSRLQRALDLARSPDPEVGRTLIEGRRGPNEKWDLSFLRHLYR